MKPEHNGCRILQTAFLSLAICAYAHGDEVAVAYVFPGYSDGGASTAFSVGDYDTATLSKTDVGVNRISSFTVESGHVVILCKNDLDDTRVPTKKLTPHG